jgi:secreted protein with Ig-like and vWFA domain
MKSPSSDAEPMTPEDRATDALLREYARLNTTDDETFLAAFEAKLAAEPVAPAQSAQGRSAPHRQRYLPTLLAIAACVLAMAGYWFVQPSDEPVVSIAAPVIQTATAQVLAAPIDAPSAPASVAVKAGLNTDSDDRVVAPSPVDPAMQTVALAMKPTVALTEVAENSASTAATPMPTEPMPAKPAAQVGGKNEAAKASVATADPFAWSTVNSPIPAASAGPMAGVGSGIGVSENTSGANTLSAGSGIVQTRTIAVPGRQRIRAEAKLAQGSGGFGNGRSDKDIRSDSSRYQAAPLNAFLPVLQQPLSTFSIDVDTASYTNLRRMIQEGQSVPAAAVRVEEMLNYFPYNYAAPAEGKPFSVAVESATCPWQPEHRLVKIALMARDIDRAKRAACNLVFLIDVSGSMNGPDRLDLVIENLRLLTASLNADDSVAIVTYAGSEGLALPPTSGGDKATILAKLDSLSAGGSTNGGAGIKLAYSTAQSRFMKGINRVVLCTDGDFNVGTTGQDDLVNLVKAQAAEGVFLTVCGYGQGNLNDAMMEAITNKGNGVYHYIDSLREGRKVFQDELLGTLVTVAKDVKLQLEFNPTQAAQYRLIGYDNRMLAKEDFANDKVDAGDIGAGHRVTALYEVIPTNLAAKGEPIPLKYQPETAKPAVESAPTGAPASPELLTVKLRYKEPSANASQLLEQPFVEDANAQPSSDMSFAAVVAEFGERLRGQRQSGRSVEQLLNAADAARGNDPHGYRAEFIELLRRMKGQW